MLISAYGLYRDNSETQKANWGVRNLFAVFERNVTICETEYIVLLRTSLSLMDRWGEPPETVLSHT